MTARPRARICCRVWSRLCNHIVLAKGGFRKDYTTKEADRSILCCIGYAACKCWNEEWTVKFIKEAADAVDFLDDEEVLNYIREKEGD